MFVCLCSLRLSPTSLRPNDYKWLKWLVLICQVCVWLLAKVVRRSASLMTLPPKSSILHIAKGHCALLNVLFSRLINAIYNALPCSLFALISFLWSLLGACVFLPGLPQVIGLRVDMRHVNGIRQALMMKMNIWLFSMVSLPIVGHYVISILSMDVQDPSCLRHDSGSSSFSSFWNFY